MSNTLDKNIFTVTTIYTNGKEQFEHDVKVFSGWDVAYEYVKNLEKEWLDDVAEYYDLEDEESKQEFIKECLVDEVFIANSLSHKDYVYGEGQEKMFSLEGHLGFANA